MTLKTPNSRPNPMIPARTRNGVMADGNTTSPAGPPGPGVADAGPRLGRTLGAGCYECGATHGAPLHTSVTEPPVCRKIDFCVRASTSLRGSPCGSHGAHVPGVQSALTEQAIVTLFVHRPGNGAVFVVGGVGAPLSHTISAEPLNGSVGMAGMP